VLAAARLQCRAAPTHSVLRRSAAARNGQCTQGQHTCATHVVVGVRGGEEGEGGEEEGEGEGEEEEGGEWPGAG
jgi:hypothetical protein